MSLFKFAKPKGPGFGISRSYYLSVLAGTAQLPSILEVVNPEGTGGAARGFGAPLSESATKADLGRRMERGPYAIASKDRKSVLKLLVLSKEEAGFDPEAFARSALSMSVSNELLARIRATWTLMQLTFESHDPSVYPALELMDSVSRRLADLTAGSIADPIAQRYLLPDWAAADRAPGELVRAEDHVVTRFASSGATRDGFTLGMQKFALPELEIPGLGDGMDATAGRLLMSLCQRTLCGTPIQLREKVGSTRSPLRVVEGGADRGRWDGVACWMLEASQGSADDALTQWAAESLQS